MKKCIKCGHELADEAVFCHICGERQVPGESPSVNTQSIADNTRQAVKEEKSVLSGCFSACLKIIIAGFCVLVLYIIASSVFTYSKMEREFSQTTVTKELPAKTVPKRTSLEWSKKSRTSIGKRAEAVNYCKNLNENGYSDWRLPTISELRTLIEHCPGTQTGGKCSVTDNCLSYEDCRNAPCRGCYASSNGDYSRFGDTEHLWSSSVQSGNSDEAWYVWFYDGEVNYGSMYVNGVGSYGSVRCVR